MRCVEDSKAIATFWEAVVECAEFTEHGVCMRNLPLDWSLGPSRQRESLCNSLDLSRFLVLSHHGSSEQLVIALTQVCRSTE